MRRGNLAGASALVLLVSGCGLSERLDDFAWRKDEGPLERVVVGADDTPGNQSLLYTAIWEAEAAEQSAMRARFAADNPAEVKQSVGEVVYAIDPAAAPNWDVMGTGIIPGWSGKGYGVQRAVRTMAQELRQVAELESETGRAASEALVCVENTLRRAELVLDLGQRLLASDATIAEGALEEIETLTKELNEGAAASGGQDVTPASLEGCGLQQISRILGPIRPSNVPI